MEFKNPHILWSLIIVPLILYYVYRKRNTGTISSPFFSFFPVRNTFRVKLFLISNVLLVISLGLFLTALARPQEGYIEDTFITEGIDIVLALDISSSMKKITFPDHELDR